MKYLDYLVNWIKEEVKKTSANGVIVGLSGGIDSALVAYLAKKAFDKNSLALILPINKNRLFDVDDAVEFANLFDINYQIIDLSNEYENIKNKIKINSDLINGNLQSRLRMMIIYAYAQKNNYLVLGTDNKSEYDLGYFTKYGDGACDLLPIVHLFKSQVYEYAKKLNFPQSIINKKPSAGLWDNQFDEIELGFSYDDYEKYYENNLTDQKLINKIKKQIIMTEHKRKSIPKPKEMEQYEKNSCN